MSRDKFETELSKYLNFYFLYGWIHEMGWEYFFFIELWMFGTYSEQYLTSSAKKLPGWGRAAVVKHGYLFQKKNLKMMMAVVRA